MRTFGETIFGHFRQLELGEFDLDQLEDAAPLWKMIEKCGGF
jgi:hypothetical protein